MGGILGKKIDAKDASRAKEIDRQLKRDQQAMSSEVKLLLLGPGESGKSTLAKQMKLLHLGGFNDAERQQFRDICHSNVIVIMKALLSASQEFGYKCSKANRKHVELVDETSTTRELNLSLANAIEALWQDAAMQKTMSRYAEFQLSDSTGYYMDQVQRLAATDYVPTDDDILRVRAKTTGLTELVFDIDDVTFRLVDVGGQRSERKKWIHCFDGVDAIIFVVALSEYDLMLYEDQSVRRMDESMEMFDDVCNNELFKSTPLILFLNKSDLFREKIKRNGLSVCFPKYKGGADFERACAFTRAKFEALNQSTATKHIYPHITCATDTENVNLVFTAVRESLQADILRNTGF